MEERNKKFLEAEWKCLFMANYEVDPALLEKYIPEGTELDLYQGKAYMSLIGFLFEKTRVLGILVPFHRTFEEVNLRFYVKQYDNGQWYPGVVFVREMVPMPAVAMAANAMYNESYTSLPMSHKIHHKDGMLDVEYAWKHKGNWSVIEATAADRKEEIKAGSFDDFVAMRHWGFTRVKDESYRYQVEHPRWNLYDVQRYNIRCQLSGYFPPEFNAPLTADPVSVLLVDGSKVLVRSRHLI